MLQKISFSSSLQTHFVSPINRLVTAISTKVQNALLCTFAGFRILSFCLPDFFVSRVERAVLHISTGYVSWQNKQAAKIRAKIFAKEKKAYERTKQIFKKKQEAWKKGDQKVERLERVIKKTTKIHQSLDAKLARMQEKKKELEATIATIQQRYKQRQADQLIATSIIGG